MLEANSKESSSSSSSRRHFGNGMFAAILLKSDKKITKLIFDFDGLSLWISYQTEMNLNQQLAAK